MFNVNNILPQKYSSNESIYSKVSIEFNNNFNKSTICKTFALFEDKDKVYDGSVKYIDKFEKVKVDISIEDKTVILTPSAPLKEECRYIVYVNNDTITSFQGQKMYEPYTSFFDTTSDSQDPFVNIIFPQDNSVIECLDTVKLSNVDAKKYVVQISKEKNFDTCIFERISDSNIIEINKKIPDGVYFTRGKSMNGDFKEVLSFAIKSYSSTPVTDEDVECDFFDYGEVEDDIEIEESIPDININVSRKTKVFINKYNKKIPYESIEPGILNGELSDSYDDGMISEHGEVDQRTFVIYNDENTYIIKEML